MQKSENPILSLNDLCIGYNTGRHRHQLLNPVNASARQGELIAVMGRNGSGKSTLFRTIMNLHPALGGNVAIGGRNISELSRHELARRVGYVSTEKVDASNMSVYDLVAMGRFPYTDWTGRNDPGGFAAIESALEKTSMSGFRDRYITELSDGERQRAMIARVLAQETQILIMDEPTAFLDISGRYEIIHLMALLAREGRTILFSTHDFNIAVSQADKIWLISDLSFTEGSPEDLVLAGAFSGLFDSSVMTFNFSDGTFILKNEMKGKIFIKGEGIIKEWTARAVVRLGYGISESFSIPYIIIPGPETPKWRLVTEYASADFDTVYQLSEWLLSENNIIS
jgi:iron complex transport system ATP-binding protein